MAIKKETLASGLVRHYSDKGFMIQKKSTGELYSDAVDIPSAKHEYIETKTLIENIIEQ